MVSKENETLEGGNSSIFRSINLAKNTLYLCRDFLCHMRMIQTRISQPGGVWRCPLTDVLPGLDRRMLSFSGLNQTNFDFFIPS